MSEIKNFTNEEFGTVRTVVINNEPYFVGKDVAEVLGYSEPRSAISKKVDEEDRGVAKMETPSGIQEMTCINESGLYSLILSSKLPSAKKFKRWVTSEVLPAIRKTGGYHLPSTYKEALQELIVQVEENEKLQIENNEMKPKAEFFDTVADSKTAIPMNEVAKVLAFDGIGRNKLFEFLRNQSVLMQNNVPYQRYIDNGWFRVVENKYQNKYNEPVITTKTLVFQKGVDGIRKLLVKAGVGQ